MPTLLTGRPVPRAAGGRRPAESPRPAGGRPPTRRAVLAGGLALAALAGCGFQPALAPGGRGRVAVEAPATRLGFEIGRRLADRLGPAGADAPYRLAVDLAVEPVASAVDPAQVTTRLRLQGEARFALREAASGRVLLRGRASGFTASDATRTAVALGAALRDAEDRLMAILADRIAARLLAEGLA